MNKLNVISILAIILFIFPISYAQEETDKVFEKEVIGKLIFLSPLLDPIYLGIEVTDSSGESYNREMYFSVDSNFKVINKKSLSNIYFGDIVSVVYDEITKTNHEDEVEKEEVERIAKAVTFKKPAHQKNSRQILRESIVLGIQNAERKETKE